MTGLSHKRVHSGLSLGQRIARTLQRDWQLWVLLLPALAFFIVFCYFPMYGVQIAFRDYKAAFGITGSKWVGLKHFEKFFSSYYCGRMFANTFLLNLYGLLFGFPIPVVLAILLNQLNGKRFKGFAQTAIYVPHFISTVVLAGMIYLFFSPSNGIINRLIAAFGGTPIYFVIEASWFRPLFIGSDIWQNAGWNTILYIATLTFGEDGIERQRGLARAGQPREYHQLIARYPDVHIFQIVLLRTLYEYIISHIFLRPSLLFQYNDAP